VLLLALLSCAVHAQSPSDTIPLDTGELREASFPHKEAIIDRLSQTGHPVFAPSSRRSWKIACFSGTIIRHCRCEVD
jgi:hypothetical protein